jgi:hypothetical protein
MHDIAAGTAFDGHRVIARGALVDVALAVKAAVEAGAAGPVLVFDDHTGKVIDLDLSGSEMEIRARYTPAEVEAVPARGERSAEAPAKQGAEAVCEPRGRGRPKLGVVAREVTLLPRHWDWLSAQRGGASAVLRRLVDEARRADAGQSARRAARDAAYRFMSAMAGDFPRFEEASRALFAGDRQRFTQQIAGWPADVRGYLEKLAFAAEPSSNETKPATE